MFAPKALEISEIVLQLEGQSCRFDLGERPGNAKVVTPASGRMHGGVVMSQLRVCVVSHPEPRPAGDVFACHSRESAPIHGTAQSLQETVTDLQEIVFDLRPVECAAELSASGDALRTGVDHDEARHVVCDVHSAGNGWRPDVGFAKVQS